ncbi:MAG: peptidoglycan-binding protein [Spirochaetaceae bacterium]|jgi:hypothetical protein|nr:peptidoglycan-binding protein [Spirochaetaceae bacterium]
MNCDTVVRHLYEDDIDYNKEPKLSLLSRLCFTVHYLLCPACAVQKHKLETAKRLLRQSCIPPSPARLSETIMMAIDMKYYGKTALLPEAIPLRIWIVSGIFIVLSLSSAYFGLDFNTIADKNGLSYLLPVGITIGGVITAYGAMFIGTHLDTLCEKFGLGTSR